MWTKDELKNQSHENMYFQLYQHHFKIQFPKSIHHWSHQANIPNICCLQILKIEDVITLATYYFQSKYKDMSTVLMQTECLQNY